MHFQKLVGLGALFAVLSMASVAFAARVWTGPGVLTQVYAGFSDGSVRIAGLANKASCQYSPIVFKTANSDPQKVESLALAAFLSGSQIECIVDGCDSGYQKGFECRMVK